MHRWSGSKETAEQQKNERNQRQARRYIRDSILSVPSVLSDEDEFLECDTSFANLNVDGEPSMPDDQGDAAAILRAEKAKPVAEANFPDDDEAWKKDIKLKFNKSDVVYWFNSVERRMERNSSALNW